MTLDMVLCAQLGLSSGNMTPSELDSHMDCSHLTTPSMFGVKDCCTAVHEMEHVCAADTTNPVTLRCHEGSAEEAQGECLSSAISSYCNGTGGLSATQCMAICQDALANAMVKAWDECMCGKISDRGSLSATVSDCCDCADECGASICSASGGLPQACITNGWVSCSTDPCSEADGSGGHNCAYYGGPSSFNTGNCTTVTSTSMSITTST